MGRHFDSELKDLKGGLHEMAAQVETMIELAVEVMVKRSDPLAEHLLEQDRRVDEMEVRLDQACIDLLGLRAPFATDLRLLASSLKIIPQLERIGDHCKNIARRALVLNRQPQVLLPEPLAQLGGGAQRMVQQAVAAFLEGDAAMAQAVIAADDEIDRMHQRVFGELVRLMLTDPLCIERATHLIIVNKNFERIADNATNIAEEVLYILQGVNVKHPYLRRMSED